MAVASELLEFLFIEPDKLGCNVIQLHLVLKIFACSHCQSRRFKRSSCACIRRVNRLRLCVWRETTHIACIVARKSNLSARRQIHRGRRLLLQNHLHIQAQVIAETMESGTLSRKLCQGTDDPAVSLPAGIRHIKRLTSLNMSIPSWPGRTKLGTTVSTNSDVPNCPFVPDPHEKIKPLAQRANDAVALTQISTTYTKANAN